MNRFTVTLDDSGSACRLAGALDMESAALLDQKMRELLPRLTGAQPVFDLSGVERLETSCAYILLRSQKMVEQDKKRQLAWAGLNRPQEVLLKALAAKKIGVAAAADDDETLTEIITEVGETTIETGYSLVELLRFFGSAVIGLWRVVSTPRHMRFIPIMTHLERMGLRAVSIIGLMSFLIGGIVAQQGAFQLKRFGADVFVVNFVGILVLRELGVLLTAIMFAGRSGSSTTAEIGAMNMREEIDAMRVIGLDPIEVLVVPRLLALVIALPLVTILSNFCALLGGLLVCWLYVGVTPHAFAAQVQAYVPLMHLFVGLVKAPFMALVIGIIACLEGLRVRGSTESLGRQTTTSVVKSIFMVILIDGVFAMIFAAMNI